MMILDSKVESHLRQLHSINSYQQLSTTTKSLIYTYILILVTVYNDIESRS